jgi:hypothetical protein
MPKRIDLTQESKYILATTLTGGLLFTSAAWFLNSVGYGLPVQPFTAAGVTLGLGIGFCRQLNLKMPVRAKTLTHSVAYLTSRQQPMADPGPERFDYIFSGLDLPIELPLSSLRRFVAIGARRQWYFYNRPKLGQWATARGPVIPSLNEILAEGYFTSEVRPRFAPVEITACKKILKHTGLLINWRQGSAGQLVNYNTGEIVEAACRRWARLTTPPPTKPNFIRKFYH